MTPVERDTPLNAPAPEFNVHPQVDMVPSRRTFLKAAGFTFAGFMASDCRPAPQHALPHIRQQPEFTPGRGYAYASTCAACEAACGLLVTTHDGRPTKIEGNPDLIKTVNDVWRFSKNMWSQNPTWYLVDTLNK